MAVSICFGLLAATLLTLLYVPALYLIVQDITHVFKPHAQNDMIEELDILDEAVEEIPDK
jgi:hypothetical protein